MFFFLLLWTTAHCLSPQMRSSNYIKFVTRCCWASLSYCINIDARPEISQCIYSLTTPDCLVDWNMGSGLFKGLVGFAPDVENNITVSRSYIKNYWCFFYEAVGIWRMLKPNCKSLWCPFACCLSQSDWRWYSCDLIVILWIISFSVPQSSSHSCCAAPTKLSIPVMSYKICLSLMFSVSLTRKHKLQLLKYKNELNTQMILIEHTHILTVHTNVRQNLPFLADLTIFKLCVCTVHCAECMSQPRGVHREQRLWRIG